MRKQGGAHLLPAAAINATALFGFPLIFAVDRGNIEVVVWAFAATGLCFFLRGRCRIAAIFIGIASAIKPFSFLYFLLLLRRRKYKDAAFGAAASAAILLVALSILGHTPWQAYQQLQAGISLTMGRYIANLTPPAELRFAHSLLDFFKSLALAVKLHSLNPDLAVEVGTRLRVQAGGWDVARTLVHIYPAVAIAAIALLAFVFFRKPALNQVIAAAASVTLFPPISSEYTLLHLYIPFGAFLIFLNGDLTAGRAQIKTRWLFAYATLFGLLFAPLTFLRIYAGACKTLVLVAILVLAASSPLPSSDFGDVIDDDSAGRINGGSDRTRRPPAAILPS
jgi:Glycosyltransferase family 87